MFIVIDKNGGWEYASIQTDQFGKNLVFETKSDAQTLADDCLDGIVIGGSNELILQNIYWVPLTLIEGQRGITPEIWPIRAGSEREAQILVKTLVEDREQDLESFRGLEVLYQDDLALNTPKGFTEMGLWKTYIIGKPIKAYNV